MAAISKEREQRRHWQQVREPIHQEADVAVISWQLRLAVLKDAKLDVSKIPLMKNLRTKLPPKSSQG